MEEWNLNVGVEVYMMDLEPWAWGDAGLKYNGHARPLYGCHSLAMKCQETLI